MRTPVPGQPLVNVSGAPGDWDGALVLTLEGKVYVRLRPERLDALGSLCRAAGPDRVSDPRWWTAHGGAATVVGPGLHFYGDHIQGPADENTVRPITSDEASHLRDEVSAAEWDESGLGDSPLAVRGIHLGGQLAGAAVLREWGGVAADVGILVAPSFRRMGLARQLAYAICGEATREAGFVVWRSAHTNMASQRLAHGLGLEAYGSNLAAYLSE